MDFAKCLHDTTQHSSNDALHARQCRFVCDELAAVYCWSGAAEHCRQVDWLLKGLVCNMEQLLSCCTKRIHLISRAGLWTVRGDDIHVGYHELNARTRMQSCKVQSAELFNRLRAFWLSHSNGRLDVSARSCPRGRGHPCTDKTTWAISGSDVTATATADKGREAYQVAWNSCACLDASNKGFIQVLALVTDLRHGSLQERTCCRSNCAASEQHQPS